MAEASPDLVEMRRELTELKEMMKTMLAAIALPIPIAQNEEGLNQPPIAKAALPIMPVVGPPLATNAIDELRKQFDKLQKTISEKGADEYVDVKKYCLFPKARLPFNFKMPEIDKFVGTSDPRIHLRMYVGAMAPLDLGEECTAQLFQRTLTGPAAQWFSELEDENLKTWDDIANAFVKQYAYNAQIKTTLRDLEVVRQGAKEGFADFVKRFRGVAAKIIDRPTEADQMHLFIKNLHYGFFRHMHSTPLVSFDQLYQTGIRVEKNMRLGFIEQGEVEWLVQEQEDFEEQLYAKEEALDDVKVGWFDPYTPVNDDNSNDEPNSPVSQEVDVTSLEPIPFKQSYEEWEMALKNGDVLAWRDLIEPLDDLTTPISERHFNSGR